MPNAIAPSEPPDDPQRISPRDGYRGNVAGRSGAGRNLGLIPLAAWTSSDEEWDDFEWRYQRIVERKAAERPQEPAIKARLAQRREWIDAYLRWGRNTLGFGLYLFNKPPIDTEVLAHKSETV